ncbi:MAG: hypothetical protein ABH867_03375 [Patescibacteria group bacterium]|nr:hypothetical protein [Patescibacteria group bacterium]
MGDFCQTLAGKLDDCPETTTPEGWLISTLNYEAKKANQRAKNAIEEKRKIRKQVLGVKIKSFKQVGDEEYGDLFNRMVCQKLNRLQEQGASLPPTKPALAYAQTIVEEEIGQGVTDEDLILFLAQREEEKKRKRFERNREESLRIFGNSELSFAYASIMFEIEERQVEAVWNTKNLREIIVRGLKGEPVRLISVICCINQYDGRGGCSINPDIYTYQKNPAVYPIPLIVDELIATRRFFEFYGINATLNIYVPDTEYTEVEKFGPIGPETSQQLFLYTGNLQKYASQRDLLGKTAIGLISALMTNNPSYQEIKAKILYQTTIAPAKQIYHIFKPETLKV